MKGCLLLQVAFKAILMISAIIFFLIHVQGVIKLYSEKRTNYSMKKESHPNGLKPPAITLCPDPAYKYGNPEMEDLHFRDISRNKHLFVNTSVWDVFTNVTYILNRDFIIEVLTGAGYPKNITMGSNTFDDNSSTSNQKSLIMNVYETNTQERGICYTIASQIPLNLKDYVVFRIIINSTLPKNQWPKAFNILLMLEEEHYGVIYETLPGISPVIIKAELGTFVGMLVHKQEWQQIDTKHDVNCTVYGNNDSMSHCMSKLIAYRLMNASTCKKPCIPVHIKSAYESVFSVTDLIQCKTVDQNNDMMKCMNYDEDQCLPPCNSVEFKALHQETYLWSGKDTIRIGMKYKHIDVTVYEEYLVYDFLNFIGSVGGSLGLFIGFSYFDFGSLVIDAIKKKFQPNGRVLQI
jgi:hypothetical protein